MNENTTPVALPVLPDGEFHAGLILKEDGTPDYWLVGLPGELESADWQTAMDWANERGGNLPSLRELNLIRANARQHFKNYWYWSCEAHESDSSWAWSQLFYYGYQIINRKYYQLRARAVRRLPI